ncbi:MAG: NADH-quinone oxidoreductase subunit N [Holophagales bacterium]|nr:NADH-quinone oxidoreductase subunit N [Holophagales bacterium]
MNGEVAFPLSDALAIAPEIALTIAGCVVLLLEAFAPRLRPTFHWLGVGAVAYAAWLVGTLPQGGAFSGLIESTPLTALFSQAVLLATGIGLLVAPGYLEREKLLAGEYPALLLWCAAGLLLLIRGVELLTLFVALELLSLCLYGLAGYHRRIATSAEAALKYFLMGAFVSAFLVYGIALVYGETGTTRLAGIAEVLASGRGAPGLLLLGMLLLACGFAFKLSLVPFHAWAPDVYQGAPSPFVAFLSVAPKVASAAVLVRIVLLAAGSPIGAKWPDLLALLAAMSMLVGNLFALVQRDIKRMLAYSGVAHMGYLMIPLASPSASSWQPILIYLVAYVLMNAGAFAIVSMLYGRPGEQHAISTLAGWGYRFPLLAGCLTVCMVSLAGIPPTAGFIGKYFVFLYAIEHGRLGLAFVGIASSLIGVAFYLRVVYMLYMKPEVAAPENPVLDFGGRLGALLTAGGTLVLGIWPQQLLGWIANAVR